MARNTTKNLRAASRYMFAQRYGLNQELGNQNPPVNPYQTNFDHDFDNNKPLTWSDAADLNSIEALRIDADGRVQFDQCVFNGNDNSQTFYLNANAALATQSFFIADKVMQISNIAYVHATLGTDAGAVTAVVTHESGAGQPGSGTVVMSNTFNCKATINTVQYATLLGPNGDGSPGNTLIIQPGDRLSIKFTGVLTALAGVVLNVFSFPGQKEETAVYNVQANATLATQPFWLNNRDAQVTGIAVYYGTAGTDAGAVTIDVTKDASGTAPGGGTSMLAATVNAKTTPGVTITPALTATVATLQMKASDVISVKFTGTLTALKDVVVVVFFQSTYPQGTQQGYYGQVDAGFNLNANGTQATQAFFIADRDYEVVDVSISFATVGGGSLNFTIDKGTQAPGTGTAVSAVMSDAGTINTPVVGVLNVSRRTRMLSQGDRLSILPATISTLAGVTGTVSLLPR